MNTFLFSYLINGLKVGTTQNGLTTHGVYTKAGILASEWQKH